MELDITIHKGDDDKPVVVFIHGLGMDKNFWVAPLETKVFAKNIPMKFLAARRPLAGLAGKRNKLTVGTVPKKINSLWFVLKDKGFNLICWSQSRPVGPVSVGVEELGQIVEEVKCIFPGNTIAIIGHSRGGLIARKFMERKCPGIKALITLSTPHHGSSLSRIEKYISPLHLFLRRVLPQYTHGTVAEIMKRTHDLLKGAALKELMPESDFIKGLTDVPVKGIKYLSFGGRKTALVTIYRWKKKGDKLIPRTVIVIPDSLVHVLPASIVPDELVDGKGDFMVTATSSVLPWAERHYNVNANHISITWNRKVISSILDVLEGL